MDIPRVQIDKCNCTRDFPKGHRTETIWKQELVICLSWGKSHDMVRWPDVFDPGVGILDRFRILVIHRD